MVLKDVLRTVTVLSLDLLVVGIPVRTVLDAQGNERDLVGVRFSAKVVHVVDGDTVDVARGSPSRRTRVRLEGVDAPESGRPYSREAAVFLRVLLFDNDVIVEGRDVDRYRRLVARVFVAGRDASVEILRAGLACHFTRYSSDSFLALSQLHAQEARRGFWAQAAHPSCLQDDQVDVRGPFRGNTRSRVYHTADCPSAKCQNCTVIFERPQDAQRAGYRPARDCHR